LSGRGVSRHLESHQASSAQFSTAVQYLRRGLVGCSLVEDEEEYLCIRKVAEHNSTKETPIVVEEISVPVEMECTKSEGQAVRIIVDEQSMI
jgi:hypothetical protein